MYVDLGSTPSDWMRRCSYDLGLPQNLGVVKTRSFIEMGVNIHPAIAQGALIRNFFDEFYESYESLYNNCSIWCSLVLPQPSREMEELYLHHGASRNGVMCKKKQLWNEAIVQYLLTCIPIREFKPVNFEMGYQVFLGIFQQGPGIELVRVSSFS